MDAGQRGLLALAALEQAGYDAWFVGGCVRDTLLGLTPADYDICTCALPEQTARVFRDMPQDHTGIHHGTVKLLTPDGELEITTFRREGGYDDGRHPGWVEFVPKVEEDLARRDFTINAIAFSPTRGYADPFGGREDLSGRILRCVGEAQLRFREDALRILRGIRFAARFGLEVEEKTMEAMICLAPLAARLSPQRVFEELTGFLLAAKGDDLLRFAPILASVIPEIQPCIGFDQHSPHHAYDVFTHIAHVTDDVPREPILRWAALLHDVGKPACFVPDETGRGHFKGHAQTGAAIAEAVLTRLAAPAELRREVCWLIGHHMTRLVPEEKTLRRALSRHGQERLSRLLALQRSDMGGKGTQEHREENPFPLLEQMLEKLAQEEGQFTLKNLAVNGSDLLALGLAGKQIGDMLEYLMDQVLNETIPNTPPALLEEAKKKSPRPAPGSLNGLPLGSPAGGAVGEAD